jgi:urea transport system permease protein
MRYSRALRLLELFVLLLLCAGPAGAQGSQAQSFEEGVSLLARASFTDVTRGVSAVAASGHDRAFVVLDALEKDGLLRDDDGCLFVKNERGVVDATTGGAKAPHGTPKAVGVNNAVRRVLGPALSELKLLAPDVGVRRAAADDLAKRPRSEARGALTRALSREDNAEVGALLRIALARLDLAAASKEERLAAIAAISELGDVTLKGDLEARLTKDSAGKPVEADADVRAAAEGAIAAIDRQVFLINLIANTFYGLSLGSVLLLAALGLAITFGLMRVINMAHGEMLMLGAYTTFVVQNLFKTHLSASFDWYMAVALPASFVVCGAVGMLLERLVIRRLYGRPLETLLATWGISLALIQSVRLMFGAQNVAVANPSWLSGGVELMPTLVTPYSRLAIVAFTVLVVTLVSLLLKRTSFGLQIRAVTQNRAMAASLGIPTERVDLLTFGLGSGLAGLGGVALSQLGNVGPELGQGYIVDSFMVVVLGGVGKLVGSVIGAVGLGLSNKYVEPLTGAVLGKIIILVLLVLFIQKRPQGLFALKGRAEEAA